MMNNRKHLRYLSIFLLLICIFQINTVNAAEKPYLTAVSDAASVEKGEYIDINVTLKNNPVISTLGMTLQYDNSILQYDSSSWGSSFEGNDMKMASDTGGEVNLSVVCNNNYSAEGVVVTVRFQAIKNTSSIPVTLLLRDITNADLSEITNCKVLSKINVPEEVNIKEDTAALDESSRAEKKSDTQQTAGASNAGWIQHESTQNTQVGSLTESNISEIDECFKTGAGLGDDIFLVIAAVCGFFALLIVIKWVKEGEV